MRITNKIQGVGKSAPWEIQILNARLPPEWWGLFLLLTFHQIWRKVFLPRQIWRGTFNFSKIGKIVFLPKIGKEDFTFCQIWQKDFPVKFDQEDRTFAKNLAKVN